MQALHFRSSHLLLGAPIYMHTMWNSWPALTSQAVQGNSNSALHQQPRCAVCMYCRQNVLVEFDKHLLLAQRQPPFLTRITNLNDLI